MMTLLAHTGSILRWWWRYGLLLGLFSVLFVALVPRSTIVISDKWQAIAYDVSPYYFDYLQWELGAIQAKAHQTLFGQHPYLTEPARSQFVRDYMADLAAVEQLEAEINTIYTDPSITEPVLESRVLQQQRDALRQSLNERRLTAEAILEGQIATVLVDEGFGLVGQLLPPMAMRLEQVPYLLVTSPRDEIRMETSINVIPLPVDERAAIEASIDTRYDVSSLIVPLGGIALYPAMVYESASLPYTVETFAHEWLHHYLYFYPLGLSYFTGDQFAGDARTINETTADLFGKEIARQVLQRYYPDLVPLEPATPDNTSSSSETTPEPLAFDFAAEMNETRVTVDELLESGEVAAAEAYMQDRQQFFYENGYRIRKLNQAFFAFYGGYQAGGGFAGAGGADPIGEAVQSIRENSASIYAFVARLRGMTTREDLLQLQQSLDVSPTSTEP